ncbi:FG-GAP repeat protein [Leucobacter chironomi]|uniref:FG-GAP repeat protein n=1 Tax=Leucobacter chironomi TaxID=491918 RepID=UPI000406C333|nr:integrin alpha [Leucobacter chironomi]
MKLLPPRSAALGAAAALAVSSALLVASPAFAATVTDDAALTGVPGSALGATATQTKCDLDGDGRLDLAVGMYMTMMSGGATNDEGAYVLMGAGDGVASGELAAANPVTIMDPSDLGWYNGGVDVRCAGDVNGDTFDDLVLVAQGSAAYIVYGDADFATLGPIDLVADLGTRVHKLSGGVGDIDGDGRDEVAVNQIGGAVVIVDAEQLVAPDTAIATMPGTRIAGAGIDIVSMAGVGDVNGDGRDDLAVGSASYTGPAAASPYTGAVWVLTDLGADVTLGTGPVPGFRIDGPARGYDLLGTSVVGLGDIDGDGLGDLLIGGESDSPRSGSAVVVRGGADGANVATDPLATTGFAVHAADDSSVQRGWWLNGVAGDDHFGHAVGAVRMAGWSMLLAGGMDGSIDPAQPGAGYVLALDSRYLVGGRIPLSPTGVFEVSGLVGAADAVGANLVLGAEAGQHLARSFADLTADATGDQVRFAAGATALFSPGTAPAVRVITMNAPAPAAPPNPGTKPTPNPTPNPTPVPQPTAPSPTLPTGDDPSPGDREARSLSRTGAADPVWGLAAAGAAVVLGAGFVLVQRRRRPSV